MWSTSKPCEAVLARRTAGTRPLAVLLLLPSALHSLAFVGGRPPAWLVGSTTATRTAFRVLWRPIRAAISVSVLWLPLPSGLIEREFQDASIEPLGRGSRPILTKIVEAAPIRSFGAPGRLKSPGTVGDARRGGWEGPSQISPLLVAFSARSAFTSRTRTTHRPTSHGPLPLLFVSDRRRPYGLRYPTLRWPDRRDTGQPKAVECHFSWFLAVFSARRSPIAAASFAACR